MKFAAKKGAGPAGLAVGAPVPTQAASGAPAVAVAADSPKEDKEFNTESYSYIDDNPFRKVASVPLSTFSVDVDTASYSNVRRFLTAGQLPPKDAVRIEELVNYFPYSYSGPSDGSPFAVHADLTECPWAPSHELLRVGLQGKRIADAALPPRNLVFLIDVSGSMNEPLKLPLVKSSLHMLVDRLRHEDRIALAVYAGSSGLVLPPTSGDDKGKIARAIDQLEAGGSTNGAEGITLAYQVAREAFQKGGINRVVLATDGDFNVGVTDEGALIRLIEDERKGGTFLSVLGFGMGNLKDSTMEKLADHGNGNYAYIDSLEEARKVLVTQAGGTLVTIAKDVKLQLEFNPKRVAEYRLIGYENRVLHDEDFKDDAKDAGDIGAGHSVTALYELVPASKTGASPKTDSMRYQATAALTPAAQSNELLSLKLRYKAPDGDVSREIATTVKDELLPLDRATGDMKFAVAVAGFGMLLRDSPHKGSATFELVERLARAGLASDEGGYRREFVDLVGTAAKLKAPQIAR
jgi:Ca-activated chloride channel family protein